MSEFEVGSTAPPFHPWCRCCTAPYFEDMEGLGKRAARDVVTGEGYEVPADMTYPEGKKLRDAKYGEGTVDAQRSMEYNKSADRRQYERYKNLMGSEAPRSFDEFQRIKYHGDYGRLKVQYADKRIQERIKRHPEWTDLKEGHQGKHIPGHNNYIKGRSYLTISMEEARQLIKRYAGTGTIKRDSKGRWTGKEIIVADRTIGYYVEPGSEPSLTHRFYITYATGKNPGAHIVPIREDEL